MKRINLEEEVVWYYLLLTYVWYFLGAQYILAPLLGWVLAFRAIYKASKGEISIPWGVWLWVAASLVLAVTYAIGLTDTGYSPFKVVSTLIFQWSRTYGLFAVFPLLGCLPIRPQLWYRACCILVLQSLIILPLFGIAHAINIGGYISPLHIIGRQGETFYAVSFARGEEPWRISLFAPWAPALGFIASLLFFICREERNRILKYTSMFGSVLMVVVSFSRLGLIALPASILIVYLVNNAGKIWLQLSAALVVLLSGLFAPTLVKTLLDFKDSLSSARASSSKTRELLNSIGIHRALTEAPIWGHGLEETGPKMVAFMPIGSHHTWIALLFVNGFVGLISILLLYLINLIYFMFSKGKESQVALGILIVMGFYSFGETWESLSYLMMPMLSLIGKAYQPTTKEGEAIHVIDQKTKDKFLLT